MSPFLRSFALVIGLATAFMLFQTWIYQQRAEKIYQRTFSASQKQEFLFCEWNELSPPERQQHKSFPRWMQSRR